MPENSPYADLKSAGTSSPSGGGKGKKPLIIAIIAVVVAVAVAIGVLAVRGGLGTGSLSSSDTVQTTDKASVISDASKLEDGQIAISVVVDGTEGEGEVWFDGMVAIEEGGNAFDALEATGQQISSQSSIGMGQYVSGINGLMDMDFGSDSGWLFYVNGEESSVSSDDAILSDGDQLTWVYKVDALRE